MESASLSTRACGGAAGEFMTVMITAGDEVVTELVGAETRSKTVAEICVRCTSARMMLRHDDSNH